jgi:hypothetical protein
LVTGGLAKGLICFLSNARTISVEDIKVKFLPLASLALTAPLLLTGCSGSNSSSIEQISRGESCREALRLMGKTTDQMTNPTTKAEYTGETTLNLIGVAQEFKNLSLKTDSDAVRASLDRISQALKKMSSGATFFEGNSMYLAEIATITKECS